MSEEILRHVFTFARRNQDPYRSVFFTAWLYCVGTQQRLPYYPVTLGWSFPPGSTAANCFNKSFPCGTRVISASPSNSF